MPKAAYFGGEREVDPFVRAAWAKLPIVAERHLPLFAELFAKHFNAGHVWRAILKEAPSDFLLPDAAASPRENIDYLPGDLEDDAIYRDAREDFEELCLGVNRLLMREVHRDNEAGVLLDRLPLCKWIKVPFDECRAADEHDGKFFERTDLPALPAINCNIRFCGCSFRLASRSEALG